MNSKKLKNIVNFELNERPALESCSIDPYSFYGNETINKSLTKNAMCDIAKREYETMRNTIKPIFVNFFKETNAYEVNVVNIEHIIHSYKSLFSKNMIILLIINGKLYNFICKSEDKLIDNEYEDFTRLINDSLNNSNNNFYVYNICTGTLYSFI